MPIKPRAFDSGLQLIGIRFPKSAPGPQKIQIDEDAAQHVKAVKPGQRKINRVKGARAWEMMVFKLMRVFKSFDHQEGQAQ